MRRNLYTQIILPPSCGIFIAALLFLFVSGCSKEDTPPPSSSEDYSLEQARALYLQNRTTITLPEWAFQNTIYTKSRNLQSAIIPNWKGAKTIKLPERNLIRHEVPLNSLFSFAAFLSKRERAEIAHTLVIEFETKTDTSRQFIATIIGKQFNQTVTYSSKKDKFRGFALFSELNGKFITGFHYANGIRTAIKMYDPTGTNPVLTSFWIGSYPLQTKMAQEPTENKYCRECISIQPFIGEVCQSCGLWSMGLQEVVVSADRPEEGGSDCQKCFRNPCECNKPDPNDPFGCPMCLYLYCTGECSAAGGGGNGGNPAEGEWWPIEHEAMLLQALKNHISPTSLKQVISGSEYADNGPKHQEPQNAHMHAMRAPGITKNDAIDRMRNYAIKHMTDFSNSNDYFALGRALHAIQDAYSPAHSFKIWNAETLSYLPHIFESFLIYQYQSRNALAETERIYLEIIAGDGSIERARAIFDAWLYRFLNF